MLVILRRIVQEVSSASDLSQALNIMVNRVAQAIQTEACSVYLLNRQKKSYILGAAFGLPEGCEVSLQLNEGSNRRLVELSTFICNRKHLSNFSLVQNPSNQIIL